MSVVGTKSTQRAVLVVVFVGLVSLVAAAAEEPPKPPETPKLAEAVRRGWIRARIVSGRIAVGGTRLGTLIDSADRDGRSERVGIRIAGKNLTISYHMSTADEEFSVQATGDGQLHVRRAPKRDSTLLPVDFRQSADEPLRLALGPKDEQRVYQAASLWHLFITQPEACRNHLAPLLQVLDKRWDLTKTAQEVESALLRAAAEGNLPDPGRWAALVEQLGDERFARREAADRELRALGRVVFTYLRGLDRGQLDAEQHYRVRRIIETLSDSMENDTPSQIASWLAGDPVIWLALLSRSEESSRRLAAERLEALLGEPVRFDPAADPKTRADQIDEIRSLVPD